MTTRGAATPTGIATPAEHGRPAAAGTAPPTSRARLIALAVHLARRNAAAAHRGSLLGSMWPLVRQLAQLAVLVFAFSAVFDLGIDNYPVFVFSGLIAWSWFSTGLVAAGASVIHGRHLVLQPSFPPAVLPLVAITVPLVDVLVALPVLGLMLALAGAVHWTVLLLPLLLAVQFVLMVGLAWIVSAVSVYLRDVPNMVGVAVATLFYLTPVFYPVSRVPESWRWLIDLNPLAPLLEAYRAVLLDGRLPH